MHRGKRLSKLNVLTLGLRYSQTEANFPVSFGFIRQFMDKTVGSRDGLDAYEKAEELVKQFDRECKQSHPLTGDLNILTPLPHCLKHLNPMLAELSSGNLTPYLNLKSRDQNPAVPHLVT